jgi:hypothetical protein
MKLIFIFNLSKVLKNPHYILIYSQYTDEVAGNLLVLAEVLNKRITKNYPLTKKDFQYSDEVKNNIFWSP